MVRFWFDGRWMLLVSILFPCQVCHVSVCLFWLVVSLPIAAHIYFANVQMSNQGRVRSGGEREFIVVTNM